MNSRQLKQNWSNLDPEMKDLAVTAILEKVYNIIIMFDVNEIHIVGNLSATKSVPSNAN